MNFNAEKVLADFEKWLECRRGSAYNQDDYSSLARCNNKLQSLKKQSAIDKLKNEIRYKKEYIRSFKNDISDLEKQLKELENE